MFWTNGKLFTRISKNSNPLDILTFEHLVSYIQGDSGGICSTLGNDSMCDSKHNSSYEHGSDFERLPRCRVTCNAFTSALRLVAASWKFFMRCARPRQARVLSIADHQ